LEKHLKEQKKSDVTYVISIKTHAYQWLEGSSFWDSPTLEIPTTKENKEAIKLYKEGKSKQRQGV
jgi:3D-(3,5/4)-trihydroxycyclohexane-1,2-dione acylhydrolase (decyclizing)